MPTSTRLQSVLQCGVCGFRWAQPPVCEDRTCPKCYAKARTRAARSVGKGTSHEVAVASCERRGAVGRFALTED